MEPVPAPAPTNQLFFTPLPNGWSGARLRLSVLLMPSLLDNTSIPDPFDHWPDIASNLNWFVTYCDASLKPIPGQPTVTATQDPNSQSGPELQLWNEIFAGVICVKRRRGTRHLKGTWRISHNITSLHIDHQASQLAHAFHQLATANQWDTGINFTDLRNGTDAPALFLHPEFQTNLADKYSDRAAVLAAWPLVDRTFHDPQKSLLDARVSYAITKLESYGGAPLSAMALSAAYISCLKSVADAGHTDPTVEAACTTVTNWPTTLHFAANDYPGLQELQHHVELLLFHRRTMPKPKDATPDFQPPDFHQLLGLVHNYPAIMRRLGLVFDFTLPPPADVFLSKVQSIQISVDTTSGAGQTLSRKVTITPLFTFCTVDKKNFYATPRDNTLLQAGLLNLQQKMPDKTSRRFTLVTEHADGQSLKRLNQKNNKKRSTEYQTSAPTSMVANQTKLTLIATPSYTSGSTVTLTATITPTSASAPKAALTGTVTFYNDCNKLAAVALSNGVATCKGTPQATSDKVTAVYSGDPNFQPSVGALSSELVATPSATASPTDAPPAPRTVGLALFDQQRLAQVEQTVGQTSTPDPDTPPLPPPAFNAEDLILGYRVDVFYKGKFYSLCKRSSTYNIYTPQTNTKVDSWQPKTPMELAADEGFLSHGATQSLIDPNGPKNPDGSPVSENTQTQLHQAVFTWTGWSLSVPQPKFPSMNTKDLVKGCPTTDPTDPKTTYLAIRPLYTLPGDGKLPPLRFNEDYAVRCRVADLAGNGVDSDFDSQNTQYSQLTIKPELPFSRHEPIRAPQFLLRQPIDYTNEPGTHVDRMVLRDGKGAASRVLVAPRESLRIAELSSKLQNEKLPPTAYSDQQLLADGAFPSVACAKTHRWIQGRVQEDGDNDGIFLKRQDDDIKVVNRYYPDPLANFARVDAFEVTDDPDQSRPLGTKWAPMNRSNEWPQRNPVRVHLKTKEAAIKPEFTLVDKETQSDDIDVDLPTSATIRVHLPPGRTVVLKISSACIDGSQPINPAQPLYTEFLVHVSHLCNRHLNQPQTMKSVLKWKADGGSKAGRMFEEAATALLPLVRAASGGRNDSSRLFANGSLPIIFPSRTMTLVHAVKRPLLAPAFTKECDGEFQVLREPGASEAQISGKIKADWPSTAKITCYAEWTDCLDDIGSDRPQNVQHHEVVFVLNPKDYIHDNPSDPQRLRAISSGIYHHFSDTRAHEVTYSLVASTNFREYYPTGGKDDASFQERSKENLKVTVLSSVRPNALKLTYVIPAFLWQDTYDKPNRTWYSGRQVLLRAYFERSFLCSGNHETVAVILADPAVPVSQQPNVSRWGDDPTRLPAAPVLRNELTPQNLIGPEPTAICTLVEGGTALAKPCKIQYSPDRGLWFTDILMDTMHANAPFVRLALARWQPQALVTGTEARCSQVIFADFMQVADCRWASVHKLKDSTYKLTISGAFPNTSSNCPFTFTLYKRWFAMDRDMGWRQVQCKSPCNFSFDGVNPDGVGSWSITFQTPGSVHLTKYRALIEEIAFAGQPSPKFLSMFINLP